MGNHYYDPKPEMAHDYHWLKEKIAGVSLQFKTDAGVFSKKGVDYGSRLLIESMMLPQGGSILDVGCGYGPIGLFAAKIAPQCQITMVDINERAIALARENAKLNKLESQVEIIESNLYAAVMGRKFDMILSNPPIRAGKQIVHQILEQGYHLLNPAGSLWVVIQKKQGAPSAKKKLEQVFQIVEEVNRSKGYYIFKAVKEK